MTVEYLVDYFSILVSVSKVPADTATVVKFYPKDLIKHKVVVKGGRDLIRAPTISMFEIIELLVAQKRDAEVSTSIKLFSKPHTLLVVVQPVKVV